MADPDVRWQQRFANFCRAREQQGLVKACESTFELGWACLRDLRLRLQGLAAAEGS